MYLVLFRKAQNLMSKLTQTFYIQVAPMYMHLLFFDFLVNDVPPCFLKLQFVHYTNNRLREGTH